MLTKALYTGISEKFLIFLFVMSMLKDRRTKSGHNIVVKTLRRKISANKAPQKRELPRSLQNQSPLHPGSGIT